MLKSLLVTLNRLVFRACLISCGFFMFTNTAKAIDLLPFDYVPAPAGTNAILGFNFNNSADSFKDTSSNRIVESEFKSHVGAVKIARYEDLGGLPVAAALAIPYGRIYDTKIGDVSLNEPEGFGDPIFSFFFWPINQPEKGRWLGIGNFLTIPMGEYNKGQALNIGENRWKHDLQIGLVQSLPGNFTLDLTVDWINYGSNKSAGTGSQKLTQKHTFEGYAWLSYNISPTSWLSVGYQATFGGKQKIDGIFNGTETKSQQVRVSYGQFITPTTKLVGMYGRDVSRTGGFELDHSFQLQITHLF